MSSYYEALPIFRAAMDAAVRIDAAVQRFPKGHRYTLGNRLRELSAEVLVLVARANARSERVQALGVLCERVEELKLVAQLGKELRAFDSFKRFTEVMEQVVSLARQAEAWRRSSTSSSSRERPEPARSAPRGRS